MDPDLALQRILETAKFVLGGTAGDMLEESAEELAQQVLPSPWRRPAGEGAS